MFTKATLSNMSEESLKELQFGELIDLLVESADELLTLNRISRNNPGKELKRKEVELIQKVILEKRMQASTY